ncbi:5950_t:CDS:2 [Entrophospora sp. SA101]|nr:5950_t:CDS:2 [Entrophospora sp. SA101]
MSSQKCEATTSSENLPSLKKCKYGPLKHQCITVKTVQIQKCTFNSILLDNSIKPTLEDELTCINTITFEKAKLLELYLLDKLDREALVSKYDLNLNINDVGEYVKNVKDASQQIIFWNYIMNQIFDINKYGNRFRFFVETDLVGISIPIFKYGKKDSHGITNISGKEVIGLDPGRKDLFVAVDNKERVVHYGTKEYRDMARFVQNRKKIKRWLNQQQALSKMCQWIIGKPQDWHYSDIVVAYGSGVFSSSPGYASGPKNSYTKG